MATQKPKTKDEGPTTAAQSTATLDDVLGAVKGVGQRVDALSNKVDSIDRRVNALEHRPELKTRIVHQERNGNGKGGINPLPATAGRLAGPPPARGREAIAPRVVQGQVTGHQDEGEDEAIQAGTWEKVVKTSRCYKVGITKTRNRDSWKVKLYLRGQRRPAAMVGWDGTAALVEFMREVWPEISEEHFDEGTFAAADEGKEVPPEFQYEGVHCLVDWFRTAPNWRGHTFINVEGVYPLND